MPARDVQLAAKVPVALADDVKRLAGLSERTVAAEIRLALRHWVSQAQPADQEATEA